MSDSTYPPILKPEQSTHLLNEIKDWSILNGLAVRPSAAFVSHIADKYGVLATTAPVTFFPSPFPLSCFERACSIQTVYNELYAAISQDEEWLGNIVQEIVDVDDFIAKLWEVHLAVKREGYVQNLTLGLFRSDYMVHLDPLSPSPRPQIRQVEFNTISSSFGGLAEKVAHLHRYLFQSGSYPSNSILGDSRLPENETIRGLAKGLAEAHIEYGPPKSRALRVCILFVVQDEERNIFDQRAISQELWSRHDIPNFRLAFSTILQHTSVDSDLARSLIYRPFSDSEEIFEVSVVYFRAGYTPADFPTATAWKARLHLERSAAIKCPSILAHLAGSKKVQQVLATPESPHLERFLSPRKTREIRATFANIYPLDDSPAGVRAKHLATDPEECLRYVLKPQREGGGNNVYRADIPHFLSQLGAENKWKGHILMELIDPPVTRNTIFREGVVKEGEVVGELGIYGSVLWRHSDILHNQQSGWLLRTKGRESEEGGVAAGFGCVDSLVLMDEEILENIHENMGGHESAD